MQQNTYNTHTAFALTDHTSRSDAGAHNTPQVTAPVPGPVQATASVPVQAQAPPMSLTAAARPSRPHAIGDLDAGWPGIASDARVSRAASSASPAETVAPAISEKDVPRKRLHCLRRLPRQ